MRRPSRSERLAAKGRPKRRAAKTHFFKYQLARDPSRAEENDLKRALQQSLEEHNGSKSSNRSSDATTTSSSSTSSGSRNTSGRSNSTSNGSSDRGNNITNSSSGESSSSLTTTTTTTPSTTSGGYKRTRSGTSISPSSPLNTHKRAKLIVTTATPVTMLNITTSNGHKTNCDGNLSVSSSSSSPVSLPPQVTTRAIRTYSRSQPRVDAIPIFDQSTGDFRSSTPIQAATNKKTFGHTLSSDKITTQNKSYTKSPNQPQTVSKSTQTLIIRPKLILNSSTTSLEKPVKSKSTSNLSHTPSLSPTVTTQAKVSDPKRNSNSSKSRNSASGNDAIKNDEIKTSEKTIEKAPIQRQYLKFKRESKNYAYAKMTALKVNTSKSPSSNSKSSKKASPNSVLNNNIANKDSPKVNPNTNGLKQDARSNARLGLNGQGKGSPNTTNSSKSSHGSSKSLDASHAAGKTNESAKTLQSPQVIRTSIQSSSDNHVNAHDLKDSSSPNDTQDLSEKRNQNQANLKVAKRRSPQGSWSLLGAPEEKVIYLRDDEPPRRLICYPAIKHNEGDVIQVRDSVLLRSGAKKTDPPYIAKVCAFWEDAETGNVLMSLFWYYRPEHTEEGRKSHHLADEIFASRHRDVDSVECIEDKCYVLTFNEYCRYRKRCKMEQVNTSWSLTDVTIPVSNESYPRRNRIPDSDVNPELVFCCRQIYDSRMKRLVKNPLINPKYGHI